MSVLGLFLAQNLRKTPQELIFLSVFQKDGFFTPFYRYSVPNCWQRDLCKTRGNSWRKVDILSISCGVFRRKVDILCKTRGNYWRKVDILSISCGVSWRKVDILSILSGVSWRKVDFSIQTRGVSWRKVDFSIQINTNPFASS